MKYSGSKKENQESSSGSAEVQPLGMKHNGGITEKSVVSPFSFLVLYPKKPAFDLIHS